MCIHAMGLVRTDSSLRATAFEKTSFLFRGHTTLALQYNKGVSGFWEVFVRIFVKIR